MIARVLPDVPAIERAFDYLVPEPLRDQVRVGTIVRVELHGRRVRGWVIEIPDEPEPGVDPKPILRVSSQGPPAEVVELAGWAAWRWAGRPQHLLRAASPPRAVTWPAPAFEPVHRDPAAPTLVRLPPTADRLPLVADAVAAGPAIVVVPAVDLAVRLARRLRREGHTVALIAGDVRADDWALAQTGTASVVGTRVAVWAPVPAVALTSVVVLDEHDEALQSEQTPTWHARDVAIERARRAGVPCTLASPVPTLEALAVATLAPTNAAKERAGWPLVDVVDQREGDPVRASLLSDRLAAAVHSGARVVCVLNRLGRSRLLACVSCGTVAACERCGAAVAQVDPGQLRCRRCATERPVVCLQCGGGRMKNLRAGVTRVREELAALAGEDVAEVTAADGQPTTRVSVGTEAVLHRLAAGSVDVAAVLDLDQELLAPRFRAAEHALALLARAARAVGPRNGGGRLLLQTRLPDHPVVRAVVLGDPSVVAEAELPRRRELRFPPAAALAAVSGAVAAAWVAAAGEHPMPSGVELLGPADGVWLVRAPDHASLADFLASVPRPPGRLRIEVDPPRL